MPAVPGTQKAFDYNIDSLVMFKLSNAENRKAQEDLARSVLDPSFQKDFNLNKGSIPVRLDADMAPFDSCAQQSMKDFKQASQDGNLVPSMAHSMAASSYVQGAIFDVVTNFFNDPAADPQKAAQQLAAAIERRRSKSLARSPAWAPLDPPDWLRAAERHGGFLRTRENAWRPIPLSIPRLR